MSFDNVYVYTRQFEGGYANHPNDRGGETFRGIARKVWPAWAGWDRIDQAQAIVGHSSRALNGYFSRDAEMSLLVENFYRENFWRPVERLLLPDRLAEKIFDIAVNCGFGAAVKMLQRAINDLEPVRKLEVDGKFGPASRTALEEIWSRFGGGREIMAALCRQQEVHYQRIIRKDPSQKVFEKGWLKRAAWVPQ